MLTPADWLAVVAQCVEQALDARPAGWDGITIRGSDEAGISQPCCPDGLLRVEWVDTTDLDTTPTTHPCRHRSSITVRVSIRRCVTAFDSAAGGSTTGGAPAPALVIAEQNQIMDDAWTVWTALACCVAGWKEQYGNVSLDNQAFSLLEGCRGSDTFLTIQVGVCCENPAS